MEGCDARGNFRRMTMQIYYRDKMVRVIPLFRPRPYHPDVQNKMKSGPWSTHVHVQIQLTESGAEIGRLSPDKWL